MKTLLAVLLIIHILSGFTSLITGGIASFTRKGGKGHRKAGRWYFWGMTGVFFTAIAISVLKGLLFLFMVGFFSYYFVVRGYRLLYLKGLGRTQKPAAIDWLIMSCALIFGVSLLAWAITQKLAGNSFWPVPMVFGVIAAGFAVADIRLYRNGPSSKQHWLTGHIASMGAGYVATWTAFVVTNVRYLPPVLVWLAPSLIGGILIIISIRRYSKPKAARPLAVAA
jgi:hypothetical protein